MSDFVQKATQDLLVLHKKTKVCQLQSDLCVEGFPRSANTFCVDFLTHICSINNFQLNIAHHTHSPLNVKLAIELGKPCLVLIREPEQAITSHMIYSGAQIPIIVQRYLDFYTEISDWSPYILIADFNLIIRDMNYVIAKLNQQYDLKIPFSKNVKKDNASTGKVAKIRARNRHPEDKERQIRTVGSPIPERDKLKNLIRPKVADYIASNTEVKNKYNLIRQLGNYIT